MVLIIKLGLKLYFLKILLNDCAYFMSSEYISISVKPFSLNYNNEIFKYFSELNL